MASKVSLTQEEIDKTIFNEPDYKDIAKKLFGQNGDFGIDQTKHAIESLSLEDLYSAFIAYTAKALAFANLSSMLEGELNQRGGVACASAYGDTNPVIGIAGVGVAKIEETTTVRRNTSSSSVRNKVVEELKKTPNSDRFFKISEELQNDILYTAKQDGTLDPKIANMITETKTTKRNVRFIPAERKEGK